MPPSPPPHTPNRPTWTPPPTTTPKSLHLDPPQPTLPDPPPPKPLLDPPHRPSLTEPSPPRALRPTVSWGGSWRPEPRGRPPPPPPGGKCVKKNLRNTVHIVLWVAAMTYVRCFILFFREEGPRAVTALYFGWPAFRNRHFVIWGGGAGWGGGGHPPLYSSLPPTTKRHQPPPTATSHQPPTANRQLLSNTFVVLCVAHVLPAPQPLSPTTGSRHGNPKPPSRLMPPEVHPCAALKALSVPSPFL